MQQPSEVLKAARGYILEFGWYQGGMTFTYKIPNRQVLYGYQEGAPVCAEGALRCVLSGTNIPLLNDPAPELNDIYAVAQSYLGDAGSEHAKYKYTVPFINDRLCHSINDVMKWFDKAIALAERDEQPRPNTDNLRETNYGVGSECTIPSSRDLVVTG